MRDYLDQRQTTGPVSLAEVVLAMLRSAQVSGGKIDGRVPDIEAPLANGPHSAY